MKKILSVVLITSFFTTAIAEITTGSGYISQTTASISLAPRDNLLIATTSVNWDTRASDSLAIDWIAPAGSYCRSSKFVLSRGNNVNNDISWAYRTVVHTGSKGQQITCDGKWIANILNVNTHKVLASAGYTVLAGNVANS